MIIQVNTDNNITGREELTTKVEEVVESALDRFSDHITRVEVHIGDENSNKPGQNDKRCVMEVRLEGRQPTAVTAHEGTVDQAIDSAAEKLVHLLDSIIGKMLDKKHRGAVPVPMTVDDSDDEEDDDDEQ